MVDKIYDYQNRLVANYTYDVNARLIRADYTDPVNNRSSYYEFTYENNRIKSIQHFDNNSQSSYQLRLFYNWEGRVIRQEAWKYGTLVGATNYEYDNKKRVTNLKQDDGVKNNFMAYNKTGDIEQTKLFLRDPDNGARSIRYFNFKYDNHQKPDFGLGYVFQIEPLPQFESESFLERNISAHNMTEYGGDGTKWIYTYNAQGLPATIETKWQGVNPVEPILLRLQYKKVQ